MFKGLCKQFLCLALGYVILRRILYDNSLTSVKNSSEFLRILLRDRPLWSAGLMSQKQYSLFHRKFKIIISLCEKTLIEKFSGKAENFVGTWFPGSDTFCSSFSFRFISFHFIFKFFKHGGPINKWNIKSYLHFSLHLKVDREGASLTSCSNSFQTFDPRNESGTLDTNSGNRCR